MNTSSDANSYFLYQNTIYCMYFDYFVEVHCYVVDNSKLTSICTQLTKAYVAKAS